LIHFTRSGYIFNAPYREVTPHSWASAEIFPGGAKSTFCLPSSGCWRCNANGCTQNASSFLHHKANAHCYGNSCIQCFPSKKLLH